MLLKRQDMPRCEGDHELQALPPTPQEHTAVNMISTDASKQYGEHEDRAGDQQGLLSRRDVYANPNSAEYPIDLQLRSVRKLDYILLPFLALLFLLNSLDKSNIGNAETAGFTRDTGLSRQDINTSMSIFFFVFVLLQPVGAALGRKIGMTIYVPICMSLWGLTTLLHMFVRARWQLILLRITIAVLESGFYPTTVSYLSLFYTKYEFGVRVGLFYGMTAVSGVLGGVLSWAVFSQFPDEDTGDASRLGGRQHTAGMSSAEGWKSWQVLFLVEGCTTMAIALLGFFWLPRSADRAWFLTREEKLWAEQRMQLEESFGPEGARDRNSNTSSDPEPRTELSRSQDDRLDGGVHERLLTGESEEDVEEQPDKTTVPATADAGLDRQDVLSAVLNYKIWHLLIVNILSAIPATAFGVLLPILVNELSPSLRLSPATCNLLSAPPFACGALVLFAFTYWSDRTRQRLVPILWGLGLLLIGLLMTVLSPIESYLLRYVALCILLSGSFIASPLTVAWLANNTPRPGKRAILLGINGWGNFAGVFIEVLFTPEDQKSGYLRPFVILLLCTIAAFAGFIAFWVLLVRENKWRQDIVRSWSQRERRREESHGDMEIPDHFGLRLCRRIGVERLARHLGLKAERVGDERITFIYGL